MPFVPRLWLALCTVSFTHMVAAAPVEYGTEAGWGRMLLDRAGRSVVIEVVGVNGHTCEVQGRLDGAQMDRAHAEACTFQLQGRAQGRIGVMVDEATRDACRENCGARAWFEGEYLPLTNVCTKAGLEMLQRRALQDYRARHYETAFQLWSQGLSMCRDTMGWSTLWRWRNDAAIAAAHAGRPADCQHLSQAVLDDLKGVTLPGETEPFTFAPSDADIARPLIAATRLNLTKCRITP